MPRRAAHRLASLARSLLFARVAAAVLMIPSGLAAQETSLASVAPYASGAAARISDPTARAVTLDLAGLFRTQKESGAYAFADAHAGLASFPLMASMSFDAYRTLGNKAALSQAVNSVGRFYTYLMTTQDRDGDRLVESAASWGGKDARAEDPAYNALLAVDMHTLARANLELRRPMPALYWYDSARAVARAVVVGTFDPEAVYFFPNEASSNRSVRQWSVLAALPVIFDEFIGPNHAEAVAARHVMRWSTTLSQVDATTQRAVERLVGVAVLRATGRTDDADVVRQARVLSPETSESIALYATERAMVDRPLKDADLTLDLFNALVRGSQKFSDPEVVRIENALSDARALGAGEAGVSTDAAEFALQTLFGAVSQLRDKLRTSAFWSPELRTAYPGADATIATHRLLDDVTVALRRLESVAFARRFGAAGLRVVTQFPRDAAVVGESAVLNWEVSAQSRTFAMKSVMAGVFGEALVPVGSGQPVSIGPRAPLGLTSRHVVQGGPGTLRLVTYMLTVEDAAGYRGRYFVERSVYAHPPVDIVARFPRGRLIAGDRVPIELDMTRRSRSAPPARYYWFSPSGLRLVEGNQGAFAFGPEDEAVGALHVEVPSPCRPGVFPFTLKFLVGDREAGTIQASLFKPYQWAFVGPFTGATLEKKLPPEGGVALLKSYDTGRRKIQWVPVPASACGPHGDLRLKDLMPDPGVGYLYTVVAVSHETDIAARLVSNGPAALFVNGRRALANTAEAGDSASGMVHLEADKNHVLIKMVGDSLSTVTFALGSDDNLAADEFDNDLVELVEGYSDLLARAEAADDVPPEARRLVTFRYDDAGANAVSVVGSFNGWSPETHRMSKTQNGRWELTLSLAPGRYAYRFLVDQKKQVLDPSTGLTEPDGYGGKNSVVVVNR